MIIENIYNYDYQTEISPFTGRGIIIDTSVLEIIFDGIILTKISKKKADELDKLLGVFDIIKVDWNKFYITPHILTEACNHFKNKHNKKGCDYKKIVKEIFPIIQKIVEKSVEKDKIISYIDLDDPVIEVGDISIFAVADDYIQKKEKIAILVNDRGVNDRYASDPRVMILDYKSIIINAP